MELWLTAPLVVCTDILESPFGFAILLVISPQVIVFPNGMVSIISHTDLRNGVICIYNGGVKSAAVPLK